MEESKIYSHKTCRWYHVCARLWLCFLQVCRDNFRQQYWNSGFVRSCFDRFLFFQKKTNKQTNKSKQNKKQNNQTKQRFTQHKQRRQQKRPDTLIGTTFPISLVAFFALSLLELISKRVKHPPPSPHNHYHHHPHLSHHFTSVLVALGSLFCCGLFLHANIFQNAFTCSSSS